LSGISSFIKKVAARLDDVARSVENHDGLAESAIRAARDRLDRAAHALDAARKESARIDASLVKLRADEHAARERARAEPAELAALERSAALAGSVRWQTSSSASETRTSRRPDGSRRRPRASKISSCRSGDAAPAQGA